MLLELRDTAEWGQAQPLQALPSNELYVAPWRLGPLHCTPWHVPSPVPMLNRRFLSARCSHWEMGLQRRGRDGMGTVAGGGASPLGPVFLSWEAQASLCTPCWPKERTSSTHPSPLSSCSPLHTYFVPSTVLDAEDPGDPKQTQSPSPDPTGPVS